MNFLLGQTYCKLNKLKILAYAGDDGKELPFIMVCDISHLAQIQVLYNLNAKKLSEKIFCYTIHPLVNLLSTGK